MKSMMLLPFLLTILTATNSGTKVFPGSTDPGSGVNKTVLLKLVNDARSKGCNCGDTWYGPAPALTWNDKLEAASLEHTNDMFKNKYFGHVAPDGSNAGERIEKAGYHWRSYGENIAQGYRDEQEVIDGWLHSPGHCKNIMGKEFREMGVARTGNLWTQELGLMLNAK
jgi:uncharacterized protein YkwD